MNFNPYTIFLGILLGVAVCVIPGSPEITPDIWGEATGYCTLEGGISKVRVNRGNLLVYCKTGKLLIITEGI